MKTRNLALTALAACSVLAAGKASAHAISIGYENAGPGSVTVWLGTYSTGHEPYGTEGSLNLVGVNGNPYPSTTVAFDLLAPLGVKPGGLIDGVTNFFAPNTTDALVDGPEEYEATCPLCGPIDRWQGVTFMGLSAGEYLFDYIPIAVPSLQWTPWNPNLEGTFDLSAVINPPSTDVPEPTTLSLLGAGLLGFGMLRRRRRRCGSGDSVSNI